MLGIALKVLKDGCWWKILPEVIHSGFVQQYRLIVVEQYFILKNNDQRNKKFEFKNKVANHWFVMKMI